MKPFKTILHACQTPPAGSKWRCESPNSDRGVGTYVRSGDKIDELRKRSNAAAARDECLCSKLTPGSACRLIGKPQQDFLSRHLWSTKILPWLDTYAPVVKEKAVAW